MKTKIAQVAVALIFLATGLPSVRAADALPPKASNPPSADAILRQMSDQLGAAQKFSFKARRTIESGLSGGDGLPGNARMSVLVQRPDKVVARATSAEDVKVVSTDGKNLTVSDTTKKFYSTVPLAASLDELPAKLAMIYGFTPPLAEFIISDPYADMVWRAQSITYAGRGNITTGFLGLKRVPCHRLALSGKLADSELWIAVSDLLPRRMTATVKGATGNVQITFEFSDWNLAAKTKDADFVFSPGSDAIQIPMMTLDEMEAAFKAVK